MEREARWSKSKHGLRAVVVVALVGVGCATPAEDDGSPVAAGMQPGTGEMMAGAAAPAAAGSGGGVAGMGAAGSVGVGAAGMAGTEGVAVAGTGMAGIGAGTGGAGAMGMAGMAGMVGMAGMGAGTGGTEPHADLGAGDGSDVIAIGDSWMSLGTVGIQQSLVKASGQPYRQLGVPGTRLLDEVIPGQYEAAKAADPDIKTVVITGGGNDILQDPVALLDCLSAGDVCKSTIDMIGDRYLALADEMAADGVEDVIIINYSRGTALGAAPIEYTYETIAPACETAAVRCHIVDPDEVAGMTMELRDGIHPTDANYDLLGEYIYDLMVAEGMRR